MRVASSSLDAFAKRIFVPPEFGRCHRDPAFVASFAIFGRSVFDQVKAQRLSEEGNGFVVLTNNDGDVAKSLGQALRVSLRLISAGFGSESLFPFQWLAAGCHWISPARHADRRGWRASHPVAR